MLTILGTIIIADLAPIGQYKILEGNRAIVSGDVNWLVLAVLLGQETLHPYLILIAG